MLEKSSQCSLFSFTFHDFRPEYYCNPSIAELDDMVDENGDVIVGDFVVGREGFGMVKFFGEFNVAGLNLDEIGNNYFCFVFICEINHSKNESSFSHIQYISG